jgi:hypothetical protein
MNAKELDEWRWEQAKAEVRAAMKPSWRVNIEAITADASHVYRRLVVEDVRPPAEPDQDTLDARAVCASYCGQIGINGPDVSENYLAGKYDREDEFARVAAVLTEIKSRVRREAIMALPDEMTGEIARVLAGYADMAGARVIVRRTLKAIKQVYGKSGE